RREAGVGDADQVTIGVVEVVGRRRVDARGHDAVVRAARNDERLVGVAGATRGKAGSRYPQVLDALRAVTGAGRRSGGRGARLGLWVSGRPIGVSGCAMRISGGSIGRSR